jgi:alpha-methylacyl-CoA racemase
VNILGDFAGGGMLAALGIMIALYERNKSGKGQVVDAAMVDGVSHLATFIHRMRTNKVWSDKPGTNLLDTGAPFYDTFVCSDGKFLSVGAIEPQFYSLMLEGLGINEDEMPGTQMDRSKWASNKRVISGRIMQKPRDFWAEVFKPEGKYRDACVAPILSIPEAMEHPHNVERNVFFKYGKKGEYLPQPAPRLSRTPGQNFASWALAKPGANTRTVMMLYGFTDKEINDLEKKGVIGIAPESKM